MKVNTASIDTTAAYIVCWSETPVEEPPSFVSERILKFVDDVVFFGIIASIWKFSTGVLLWPIKYNYKQEEDLGKYEIM